MEGSLSRRRDFDITAWVAAALPAAAARLRYVRNLWQQAAAQKKWNLHLWHQGTRGHIPTNSLRHSELCTIRRTWFINEFLFLIYFSYIFIAGNCERRGNSSDKKKWKCERGTFSTGRPLHGSAENQNYDEELQSDELQGVPDWLQEFKHGLVDESVPEHRDTSSSSHQLPLEPRAKVVPTKHNIFTHFPTERNCDICLRTQITRASCRRRTGTVVPRAETSGDLITADHKFLSEGCESRHDHRYAVVVQDLATQRIQSYPCKTETSQETQKSLQKFLEPTRKVKVIYTDNSLELGKACESLTWNHCTSTPHRSETNGIAERAISRGKEGTSAVLSQSGLDEKWLADSRNVTAICETFKMSCLMGRDTL